MTAVRHAAVLTFALLAATTTGHAQSPRLSPFAQQKAATLLREKYSCLGCHRWQQEGGQLAPSLHDVTTRRDPAYIAGMVTDPQRTRPGALMPRVRMPESDRLLLIRYLGGDPAAAQRLTSTVGAASAAQDTVGAVLYRQWCAGCHGAAGNGDGVNARALPVAPARHNDASRMRLRPDDSLYDTIDGGGAIMNKHVRMPAFGGTLTPGQIRALVRHIRTLCRCEGPEWSRS